MKDLNRSDPPVPTNEDILDVCRAVVASPPQERRLINRGCWSSNLDEAHFRAESEQIPVTVESEGITIWPIGARP